MTITDRHRFDQLRGQVRRRARSARRVAIGARDLSPVTALRFAVDRARGGGVPAHRNTSYTFVDATAQSTTLIWIHNYWSDAYGLDRPHIAATLLDGAGASVAEWAFTIEPDATAIIDIRERCEAAGCALPFEGHILLEAEADQLIAGRPVQVFAEYVTDSGEASGVHGQYGRQHRPLGQVLSGMRVDAAGGQRTGLVLLNGYDGPGGPHTMRARIDVHDAGGRRRRATVEHIAPQSTRHVMLDELFDDLDGFLGGRPGHARVRLPMPSSRMLFHVDHPDGTRVVNHGTVDRLVDQGAGASAGWSASAVTASVLAVVDERRDTVLTLVNLWGPVPAPCAVTMVFHAGDGKLLGRDRIEIGSCQLVEVSTREALVRHGATVPTAAHVQITVEPLRHVDQRPAVLDVLVGIVDEGVLAGGIQVGGEYFNASVPPGLAVPDVRRTRVFTRVRAGDRVRTRLFLANPSASPDWNGTAEPMLTLLDTGGTILAKATLSIPARGFALVDVQELFAADVEDWPSDTTLRIRDTGARLYGFSFVETEGARTVPICHLLGG